MSKEKVVKPPIGLMPEWRYKELRIDAIDAAMKRYDDAGYSIPYEWKLERHELIDWLREHLPTSPYLKQAK
jgi:hypothetical protein